MFKLFNPIYHGFKRNLKEVPTESERISDLRISDLGGAETGEPLEGFPPSL